MVFSARPSRLAVSATPAFALSKKPPSPRLPLMISAMLLSPLAAVDDEPEPADSSLDPQPPARTDAAARPAASANGRWVILDMDVPPAVSMGARPVPSPLRSPDRVVAQA